ncbi:MAG: hypothetical protein K6F39_03025 [Lachnospiraceae bacterium]|nr:hypothetical protein [Lachnospiraceae bacterium]
MSDKNTAYQCPNCTGPLHYDADSAKLKCDFCLSTFDVAEIEELYKDKNKNAEENERESYTSSEGTFKGYICSTCGAELVCEETTAATSCPYCGNPTIIPGRLSGSEHPDYCIPFVKDKKKAVEALKGFYKHKLLLPNSFVVQNHLEEIQGVYVPFWFYSGTAEGSGFYQAEKTSVHTHGDVRIITTRHYDAVRSGSLYFEKIPVDASSKMADDLMDSIEPFNYEDLKEFKLEYLPGYSANKYDVSKKECMVRATARANATLESELKSTVHGYDTVNTRSHEEVFKGEKIEYGMLPVWLLNTKWNDKNFMFAMNGQTGKMVGNLPISILKSILWIVGMCFIGAAIGWTIFEDEMITAISGIALSAIIYFVLYKQMKNVGMQGNAYCYESKEGLKLQEKSDIYTHTTERRERIERKESR